ncbi:putative phosphatidate phosphatase isoform X2 [Daphnia pulex]|uniref:putative phosphatidate phosphatase isoform X2 n=1 Tax=Daphnia pulex TaxID=6669 RepID=UPI001EDD46E8|nr:putative phosphatidate phosphatase isoform X2 [Daphnia pulex]XP_046648881.1 putative phosphatidate phosphatase isoform X2 [Daphnia pulicaria]
MAATALIRQVVIDFICLAIVWLPVLLLHLLGKAFQRGFYCDDASIRYPFKESTVTNVVLYCYSLGLPILSMIIIEIFRWRNNSNNSKRLTRQNSASTINVSSAIRIPSVIAELVHLVAIFLFGAACSQLATDFGKYTIGRLRPHFIAVCQPENFAQLCPLDGPPTYITDYKCTGDDEKLLRESRLSFPSGHSSFSAYTMLFLAFYLQRRMNWSGSKLLRPTIQICVLMLSWYTGLSRVSDYKHHWSDVLSGFLIGAIAASLTALYVSRLFQPSIRRDMALVPQSREDVEMQQNHLQASAGK